MSQSEIDEIYQTHRRFIQAITADGFAGIVQHLDDDVFFMPPGEPSVRGIDAVREWCDKVDGRATVESMEGDGEQYTHAGDYVVETGRFRWKLKPAGGGDALADSGKFLAVWKRQDEGGWKIIQDIWNTDG